MPDAKEQTYREIVITHIRNEAKDVKTFTLAAADGVPIIYQAGQFLTFVFNRYGKEERRSYSVSGAPALNEPVNITLKRVDNGAYSRWFIDNAKEGDVLQITGAAGLFTLPKNAQDYKQLFFFAAGIGITPIYSLIKEALHAQPHLHITLIYSNNRQADVVFAAELKQLAAQFSKQFRVEFLYSNSFNLSRARLNKMLLPILLEEYALAEKQETLYYLCGPFAYMRMVTITLEELGIPADHVRKENFDTRIYAHKVEPPDKAQHAVTLLIGDELHTIPVQYPATILSAARANHITIPYSCETGRCGSCVALCTQGRVWMSYNEVLTDADIAAGKVLTCVGHPVGGDVVLEV